MVNQAGGAFVASDLPEGRVPVLFSADWCGYCRPFEKHFKRFQEGWIVDASDEDDPVWDRFALRVVPTVILFEDGVPKRRWEGALGERDARAIEAAMGE